MKTATGKGGGRLECHYPHDPWDNFFPWLKYGHVTFHAFWVFA